MLIFVEVTRQSDLKHESIDKLCLIEWGFEGSTLLALERNTATIVSVMTDDGNPQLTDQPTVLAGSHNCASDDFRMPIHGPKSPLRK
jgi:hypothetical protein